MYDIKNSIWEAEANRTNIKGEKYAEIRNYYCLGEKQFNK